MKKIQEKSITEKVKDFYNNNIDNYKKFRKKNIYYHNYIKNLLKFLVPERKKILDIGCGFGDFLNELKPTFGLGIDIADKMIEENKKKYPELKFEVLDIQNEIIEDKFDYILLVNTIGDLEDIWKCFRNLKNNCNHSTRLVIIHFSYLWEPILRFGERIGLKITQPPQNWLNFNDISNLLYLNGFEVVKQGYECIFPFHIPVISEVINKIFSNLPFFHRLGLISYAVAKPQVELDRPANEYSVSVIIPVKNEKDYIEEAVTRTPNMGLHTEIIFVDGHSTDGTKEKIQEIIELEKGNKDIKFIEQKGKGKGEAVRTGFDYAAGDVLMILDCDLTVPPEDLFKFYKALEEGKGEFVNGSRLVYPMEEEAMRTLNLIGNKFFALSFTFLLGLKIKDTLCGTKVLKKSDYNEIAVQRGYFGEFDPFGDFDLLFGAAKNNLKIIELPVRYKKRVYGETKISRFSHGFLLLKMVLFGFLKFKLRM